MILGQLTMGARKTKNGPLMVVMITVMMLMLMTVLTMMIAKGRKVGWWKEENPINDRKYSGCGGDGGCDDFTFHIKKL